MVKKNKAGQMNALMELGPVTGCRDTITCGYNVGFLYKSKGILCIRYNFLIRKVIACQPWKQVSIESALTKDATRCHDKKNLLSVVSLSIYRGADKEPATGFLSSPR